ncbi:hypothetical protein BCF33_0627 [Hasllibacter halocynthiae]|uniref:D-galactarate dehydratase n=1 Tax=Hasllibacter halocynthiae TaxID=595589 RepID=A0A2T0X7Y8_9RHOB|nr:hypothetical protein [Hasllibacter halocynthiae]PRY95015.1 hypothetical protein BCF33_0627 [Hasllibacter halocynthiae]
MRTILIAPLAPFALLAACAAPPGAPQTASAPGGGPLPQVTLPETPGATDAVVAEAGTAPPPRGARTADQFDTTTAEERAVAVTAAAEPEAAPQRLLGTQVVALGDPSETGLWLATDLVSSETPGRVVDPANGNGVLVELRPLAGSGAPQISLAALRLLGASLTALPEVEIYAR